MQNHTSKIRVMASILALLVVLEGCAGMKGERDTARPSVTAAQSEHSSELKPRILARVDNPADLLALNSILVAPVDVSEKALNADVDALDLNQELSNAVSKQVSIKVYDQSKDKLVRVNITREEALAEGKKLMADGVLLTNIRNFLERTGSAVGGDPGAVNFTMSVLRVSDGKEIWNVNYHYKDQALSDNLFRIGDRFSKQDGPGWRSAQKLLVEGFNSALSDLAERRIQQFTTH